MSLISESKKYYLNLIINSLISKLAGTEVTAKGSKINVVKRVVFVNTFILDNYQPSSFVLFIILTFALLFNKNNVKVSM